MSRLRMRAFTLIEVLIVVVIMGILASIVIVNVASASQQSRAAVLKTQLKFMYTQMSVFKQKHNNVSPGVDPSSGTASESTFESQMTKYVDDNGYTSATRTERYRHGPYLDQLPMNPFNSRTSITFVADGATMPAADNSTGWIYKPETLEIYANHPAHGPGVQW